MKRAFTLIELLVVIAIIAILAAILFPVFAQAKLQAKKSASLANTKEVGLAELMYMNDADDNFVLGTNQCDPAVSGALCVAGTGPGSNENIGYGSADSWVYLTQPYIKNFGILVDPGVGDNGGYVLGGNSTRRNQDFYAQYGYNYLFLSPWYDCAESLSRNGSAAIHPATTVMFSTSQGFTTHPERGFYDANPPGAWPLTAPAPHSCIWWDGRIGSGNWSANNPAYIYNIPPPSHITSSSRAWNMYRGANTVWVDGHAKFCTDGYLATGTDYGTASASSMYPGGAVILNLNTYLWTLDGTTNDLVL